jgi:hypothetical protein
MLIKTRHYEIPQDECSHSHDTHSKHIDSNNRASQSNNYTPLHHSHSHGNHFHVSPKNNNLNIENSSKIKKLEFKDPLGNNCNSVHARMEKSLPSLILEETAENNEFHLATCHCASHETKTSNLNVSRNLSQADLQKSQVCKSRTINLRYQKDFRYFNLDRNDFSPRSTKRKSLTNSKTMGTRRHSRLLRNLESYIIHSEIQSCNKIKNYEMNLYDSNIEKKKLNASLNNRLRKQIEGY